MVTNRLMWIAISRNSTHPCEVNDPLADGMIGVGVGVLSGMGIIVMTIPAITLEFVVGAGADAVDVLTDLLTVPIIDVVSDIDVDMFADENVNGLAVMMTPLEFTLSAPWEESMSLC